MQRYLLAILLCSLGCSSYAAHTSSDRNTLSMYGGVYDPLNPFSTDYTYMVGVQYMHATDYFIEPLVGAFFTADSAGYAYTGFGHDFHLGNSHWHIVPKLAAGLYKSGAGKDLGGPVEFRSALEVRYDLAQGSLGIEAAHLSNAGLYDSNPGTETLTINYNMTF